MGAALLFPATGGPKGTDQKNNKNDRDNYKRGTQMHKQQNLLMVSILSCIDADRLT
jgi:hypothetical protein